MGRRGSEGFAGVVRDWNRHSGGFVFEIEEESKWWAGAKGANQRNTRRDDETIVVEVKMIYDWGEDLI